MYDPATNFSSLLAMILDVLGTSVSGLFLPIVTMIITPLFSILQLFQ